MFGCYLDIFGEIFVVVSKSFYFEVIVLGGGLFLIDVIVEKFFDVI